MNELKKERKEKKVSPARGRQVARPQCARLKVCAEGSEGVSVRQGEQVLRRDLDGCPVVHSPAVAADALRTTCLIFHRSIQPKPTEF